MKKHHPFIVGIMIGSLSFALIPPTVNAGGAAGGGATEVTQIANNAQLIGIYAEKVKSYAKQLEQLQQEVLQYQNMIERLKIDTDNWTKLATSQWGDVMGDINKLAGAIKEGEAIAFSLANIDEVMREKFKGYTDFLDMKNLKLDVFEQNYKEWSDTLHSTVRSTMKGTQLQYEDFKTEEATMKQLQSMNDNAVGQMQAIQVSNQIANQYVGQLQKMRALLMLQNQLISTEAAKVQSEQDITTARISNYLREQEFEKEEKGSRKTFELHEKGQDGNQFKVKISE